MLMKCLFKTMVRGEVVKVGQVLDLTEAECAIPRIKEFFVKVGAEAAPAAQAAGAATPAQATAVKAVVAGLTRDQAIMKLQQAGAAVKGNISTKALVELYNQTFANAAEATQHDTTEAK